MIGLYFSEESADVNARECCDRFLPTRFLRMKVRVRSCRRASERPLTGSVPARGEEKVSGKGAVAGHQRQQIKP